MSTVELVRRNKLIRKVTLTIATGFVTFALAQLIERSGLAFQVGTSLFLSGVVFVVMYLIDVEGRLDSVEAGQQRHASSTESLLQDGFHNFSRATATFAELDLAKTPTEQVMKLVDDISHLDAENDLVIRFAQTEIERLGILMHDMTHGNDSVYEGEDRDWMLNLTRSASISIDAISLTTVDLGVDGGLWLTDLGQRYLQLQRDAIGRGVVTRRVFVAEDEDKLQRPDFLEICEMHRDLGVKVKVLNLNDAPGTLVNTMFDFIVFDNALSYESIPASQRTNQKKPIIIITTRLVRQEARVKERIQRFGELWDAARELPAA
ncbi:MAG TPA: hypothetical protein VF062_08370 [Candidatus Limnocylindrales bacterium]